MQYPTSNSKMAHEKGHKDNLEVKQSKMPIIKKREDRKKRRKDNTNLSRDCHIVSYMRNFIQKKKKADYFAQQQHQKSKYG